MMADIDREMAEKVMGWFKDFLGNWVKYMKPTHFDSDAKQATIKMCKAENWHPSTDISQALGGPDTVVGKMRKKGFSFSMAISSTNDESHVEFVKYKDGFAAIIGKAKHKDPAMAICLAAEKAMGG